jgi:hypothetical protein
LYRLFVVLLTLRTRVEGVQSMFSEGQSVTARSMQSGCKLAISYRNGRSSPTERRVVYVGRGTPPITAAEVEIMFEYLEGLGASASAQNDNMAGND